MGLARPSVIWVAESVQYHTIFQRSCLAYTSPWGFPVVFPLHYPFNSHIRIRELQAFAASKVNFLSAYSRLKISTSTSMDIMHMRHRQFCYISRSCEVMMLNTPSSTIFMSAEALSRLSLGDTMVTTRAGAARARTAPPQRGERPPSSSSSATSPTPSLIESDDGHVYDVSNFDDDLRRRAKRGLLGDNDISMKFCKEIEDDPTRYLFHLEDDITVALDGGKAPKCSCGANETGKACKVSIDKYDTA
jgi:hypothetical protein